MIRLNNVTIAVAGLLLGATLALGQGDGAPGEDATLRDTPGVNAQLPHLVPGSKGATDGDLGEHQVTGTVRELDASSGAVVVDVKGKELRFLFPANAVAKLDKGDEVTVTVAVHRNSAASK